MMDPQAEKQSGYSRLRELGVLDTPEDKLFRAFAEQALGVVPGTTIAAVNLIDADRQWFKTIIGLDAKETPRSVAFCSHTIETDGALVVEDATRDNRFAGNPLVTAAPAIRFYAGVKLTNGVGALCVIGQHPRKAAASEITKLTKLARFVDVQLLAHGTLFHLKAASGRAERKTP